MEKFEASNGVEITSNGGRVTFKCTGTGELYPNGHQLTPAETKALREFFRAELDEELGRWRWPEGDDWVVRELDRDTFGRRRVECLNERTFEKTSFNPVAATGESDKHRAARAYFEAHPERKPWEEAEDGEIWVLTGAGGLELPWLRQHGDWISNTPSRLIRRNVDLITAGRRIWPEPD